MKDKKEKNYNKILKTPKWYEKRDEIIRRDNNRCMNCGSTEGLQVHHRQYHIIVKTGNYRLPWEYPGRYLVTLCEACHKKGHENYKVPVFIV